MVCRVSMRAIQRWTGRGRGCHTQTQVCAARDQSRGSPHRTTAAAVEHMLHRPAPRFPRKRVSIIQYGPANAVYLGPGAVGVVVYEG